MSASREKQKRRGLNESGQLNSRGTAKKKADKSKLKSRIYGTVALVFVVIFICLVTVNSDTFLTNTTAATVGGHKVSVEQFNYYYWDAVSTVEDYYGDYFSYFCDTSVDFDEQSYSDDMTWEDYFADYALSSMQQTYILVDAAEDAGYTLSEDSQSTIDSLSDSMDSYADSAGYSDADSYMENLYGKGCTGEGYIEYMTDQYLASEYYNVVYDSFSYTDDEINEYYSVYSDDYDTVCYRYFFLSSSETDDMTEEEAATWALSTAQSMAADSEGNQTTFNDLCAEYSDEDSAAYYTDDPDYSLVTDATYDECSSYYADWLFNSDRVSGETTYVEGSSGYYVVYFVSRDKPDYDMVNVRHILISVDDTTDEDEMASAEEEAESILSEWEAGDMTEDSFGELADEYSDDSAEGGLYEDVYKGEMVSGFEEWCFDESRAVGDTGIVESSYGYHVMYFCDWGDNYLIYAVDETLRSDDYTAWYDEQSVNYEANTKSWGLHFATT